MSILIPLKPAEFNPENNLNLLSGKRKHLPLLVDKKTSSLSDAISHLKSCSFRPGILLFTASDADSAYSMRFFENQIINSQTKK